MHTVFPLTFCTQTGIFSFSCIVYRLAFVRNLKGYRLHTHTAFKNHYRGLRLFCAENCVALLDEHDVAAVLANNLGILWRLLGHAQSGRLGAVYLLLRGDCNILRLFLCSVIQIGLISGSAILFGFASQPVIEKRIGVKIIGRV